MDSIKSTRKLEAMKYYKKGEFLISNLILHSLIALICTLFCSYYSLSSMDYPFAGFVSVIQNFMSLFFNPKWLFIIGNVIVAILVRESKLAGSRSSPATEIYNEYVKRSQALHDQASVYKEEKELEGKVEKKSADRQERKNSARRELKKKNMMHIMIERDHQKGEEAVRERDDEEEGEGGLAVEELNKRVEDFIARVNRRRWLEDI